MPCYGRIWWFRLKRGVIYVIYLSGILMRENFGKKQGLKFDQNGFFNPKWQTSCSPETYFACSGMIDTSTECVATRERGDGDYISGTAQALFSWKRQIKNIILSQSCKTFLSFLPNFLVGGWNWRQGLHFCLTFRATSFVEFLFKMSTSAPKKSLTSSSPSVKAFFFFYVSRHSWRVPPILSISEAPDKKCFPPPNFPSTPFLGMLRLSKTRD